MRFIGFFLACFWTFSLLGDAPSRVSICSTCQDKKISEIQERGFLIVGTIAQDFPPYVMVTKKGLKGTEMRLAHLLASYLGVKLKVDRRARTYEEVINNVEKGITDIGLAITSITIDRALRVNFSIPYMKLQKAILLNRSSFNHLRKSEDETLREFYSRGYKIGVQRGTSYVGFALSLFPKAKVIEYNSWPDVVMDLGNGKIEGAMNDNFEMLKTMWSSAKGLLKYIPIVLKEGVDPIGIVIPSNSPHFLNWINTVLTTENIHFNLAEIQQEYENYLKDDDPYDK